METFTQMPRGNDVAPHLLRQEITVSPEGCVVDTGVLLSTETQDALQPHVLACRKDLYVMCSVCDTMFDPGNEAGKFDCRLLVMKIELGHITGGIYTPSGHVPVGRDAKRYLETPATMSSNAVSIIARQDPHRLSVLDTNKYERSIVAETPAQYSISNSLSTDVNTYYRYNRRTRNSVFKAVQELELYSRWTSRRRQTLTYFVEMLNEVDNTTKYRLATPSCIYAQDK